MAKRDAYWASFCISKRAARIFFAIQCYVFEISRRDSKHYTLIEEKIVVIVSFGISRTLRKTAEARAAQAGLSAKLQDRMNRWKTVEAADGERPRFQCVIFTMALKWVLVASPNWTSSGHKRDCSVGDG